MEITYSNCDVLLAFVASCYPSSCRTLAHSLAAFYAMYGKDYDDHDAEWKTEYEKSVIVVIIASFEWMA